MPSPKVQLYNETTNTHPRGFFGMLLANQLLERGWREITVGLNDHFWVSPTDERVGTLEFAYQREFGRVL